MTVRTSKHCTIFDLVAISPPTRPTLRDRYERRRARVIVGAARVFAERGYDQTSIQDLADELGMAAGGLYHYIGSKEELLRSICDALMDPLLERARALVTQEEREPAAALRALVRLWVAHVVAHRDHVLVFQQERHVIGRGAQWRRVRSQRKQFERLVEDLLERVQADGGLALADTRLALSALLGMVNHTAQWFRPRGRLSAEQIADGYVDLLLAR
jgi:TetR/AcrR family transcriptional regulator, cholesterol catabolism regulator